MPAPRHIAVQIGNPADLASSASPPSCHDPAPISPGITACSPRTSSTVTASSPTPPIKAPASLLRLVHPPCAGCSGSNASSISTSSAVWRYVACHRVHRHARDHQENPHSSRRARSRPHPQPPRTTAACARCRTPRLPVSDRALTAPTGAPRPHCASPPRPPPARVLLAMLALLPNPNRISSTAQISALAPATNPTTITPILPQQRRSAGCFSYPWTPCRRCGGGTYPAAGTDGAQGAVIAGVREAAVDRYAPRRGRLAAPFLCSRYSPGRLDPTPDCRNRSSETISPSTVVA